MFTTAQSTIVNCLKRAQIYPNENLGDAAASSASMAPTARAICQFSFIIGIFWVNFWPPSLVFSGYAQESSQVESFQHFIASV